MLEGREEPSSVRLIETCIGTTIVPRDYGSGDRVGYNAGNLHWRVKFERLTLLVALGGTEDLYRARVQRMTDAGAIARARTRAAHTPSHATCACGLSERHFRFLQ